MSVLQDQWRDAGLPLEILHLLNSILHFESRCLLPELTKDENLFEEFELKFKAPADIFTRVQGLASRYEDAALERSFIYDLADKPLHALDARLRIRLRESLLTQEQEALITVKKPKPNTTLHGAREFEAEVLLQGAEAAEIMDRFHAHGLELVSSYERIRHSFSFSGQAVKADIDLSLTLAVTLRLKAARRRP